MNIPDTDPTPHEATQQADHTDAHAGDAHGADTDAAAAPADASAPQVGDAGLRGEVDTLRDRHLRLAAEFDNYRKRTERERTESWTRAQAQLVEKLLDAIDDLQRVAALQGEAAGSEALLQGVRLVERKLVRTLEAAGLETLDAEGKPFDPTVHEAIVMMPTDAEAEDDTVAQVFQPGYLFKGVLLRPARVQVKRYGG